MKITLSRLVPDTIHSEAINICVRDHQERRAMPLVMGETLHTWEELNEWADRFNTEFRLCIASPVVTAEDQNKAYLGSFSACPNTMGIANVVNLNAKHLKNRSWAAVLETLLHELLHQWQLEHGSPAKDERHHNRQFQEKARALGLIVNRNGSHSGIIDGPFVRLLRQHGVAVELTPPQKVVDQTRLALRGKARVPPVKLVPWLCACAAPVWVAAGFSWLACCGRCNQLFTLASEAPEAPEAPEA